MTDIFSSVQQRWGEGRGTVAHLQQPVGSKSEVCHSFSNRVRSKICRRNIRIVNQANTTLRQCCSCLVSSIHDDILTSLICRRNPRIVNQATTTLRQCWPNPFSAEREGCSLQYYHSALYNICRCTLQKNKWQRVIETNNNSRNTM